MTNLEKNVVNRDDSEAGLAGDLGSTKAEETDQNEDLNEQEPNGDQNEESQ